MRPFYLTLAAALALGSAAPLSAQTGWWAPVASQATTQGGSILRDAVLGRPSGDDRARQDQRVPTGNARNNNGNARGNNANARSNGNGPPFCRSGGHPVHGMSWCRDKGWVGNTTWANAGWGDVILGRRAPDREQRVNQSTIGSILGDAVLGRVSRFGRDAGYSGALDGRWLPLSSGGAVLQLRMGGVPIAEFADLNRDGRAELVLLNHAY